MLEVEEKSKKEKKGLLKIKQESQEEEEYYQDEQNHYLVSAMGAFLKLEVPPPAAQHQPGQGHPLPQQHQKPGPVFRHATCLRMFQLTFI